MTRTTMGNINSISFSNVNAQGSSVSISIHNVFVINFINIV